MNSRGLTLIELIVTISIATIIAGIGIPKLNSFFQMTSADSTASLLFTSYQSARTAAVTNGKAIKFCGSDDAFHCKRTWKNYILVFSDFNHNNIVDDGELISARNLLKNKGKIVTKVSLGLPYVTLNSDGSARQLGSMIVCPPSAINSHVRAITWNRVGRSYNNLDLNNDGTVDNYRSGYIYSICH